MVLVEAFSACSETRPSCQAHLTLEAVTMAVQYCAPAALSLLPDLSLLSRSVDEEDDGVGPLQVPSL